MTVDQLELAHRCNERMMMAHGIEVGQVRQWGPRTVTVLRPADTWPRNGKGMVLCSIHFPGNEPEESHCWPETVAKWPLIDEEPCPAHGKAAAELVTEALNEGRLIAAQPPATCELCGVAAELRPYGPNGERVCFACGMKDEDACKRAFDRRGA